MKRKIILSMLIIFVTVPFIITRFCYNKNYESQNISRNIVVKKNNKIVGYIKGSVHFGFKEEELDKDKSHIESIIHDVSNVFFETNSGHWSAMSYGLERVAFEGIEKEKRAIDVKYLESLDSQIALVHSLFLYGENIYYVPYGKLFLTYPWMANILNTLNSLIVLPGNLVYQNIINSSFSDVRAQENSKFMEDLRNDFFNNKTGFADSKIIEQFRIVERDKLIYDKFIKEIKAPSEDNKFLIIIGVFHLSANDGLLSHFKNDGFVLEELN